DNMPQIQHDHSRMNMNKPAQGQLLLPSPHASSGTGWQPASSPQHLWMTSRGGWNLMLHGNIFLRYNQQGGPRGAGKAESSNYAMMMEEHRLGRGTLLLRQMFSAESLTSRIPGAVSDGRNLSRPAANRSPASSQRICRTFGVLHTAVDGERLVDGVRWP